MLNIFLFCLMLLALPQSSPQMVESKTNVPRDTTFTIAPTRSSYYVGEPLNITMKLKSNVDGGPVNSYFTPNFGLRNLSLYYRHISDDFNLYSCMKMERPRCALVLPSPLKPQEEIIAGETVVYDTSKNQFVLDKPGIYEFKAVYRNPSYIKNEVEELESNTFFIEVMPTPANEIAALELYKDEGIGKLLQFDGYYDPALMIRKASLLIKQYPQSIYSKRLKKYLFFFWIPARSQSNLASKEEIDLYIIMCQQGMNKDEQESN